MHFIYFCFTFNSSEVTIIPTYDTDVLGYWVAENEELLTELKIDLAPSASRCTINLQVMIANNFSNSTKYFSSLLLCPDQKLSKVCNSNNNC